MMSLEICDISPNLILHKADESSTTDSPVSRSHSTNKQNVVSRYLRASMGSCHDACKYGKSHEFRDSKPWKSRRRVSAPPPNNKNNVDIRIFVDRKVKDAVKIDEVKPSPANEKIKKGFPSCRRTPLVDSSKDVKQEGRSSSKQSSYEAPKMAKKVVQSAETLKTLRKSEQNKNTREGRSCTISSSNEAPKMVQKVVHSLDTLKIPRQSDQNKNTPRQAAISARKRDALTKRASSNAKERNGSVCPLRQDVTTMESSSSPNPKKSGEKKMTEPKTANARVSQVAAKKISTPSTVTSPLRRKSRVATNPSPNLRITGSNMKRTKSPENNSQISKALIEKGVDSLPATLNGTECIQSLPPLPGESSNSSSQTYPISFTSHETDSECDDSISSSDGSGKMDGLSNIEGLTHGGETLEDGENPKSVNLKFRRGKVIDPECEPNKEMKVKFKQGKTLGTKQEVNGGSRQKSYRKRATNNLKRDSEVAPTKVVLRHQDVEIKKEEQVLLNNVIEQTANKLVETRKSKVKALVGAFETVISLQERKSSTVERCN